MPTKINFSIPCFKEPYDHLKMKQFGQFYSVDWQVLKQLGLDKLVLGFLSIGGWTTLFDITEDTYRVATLEVLSTIKIYCCLTSFNQVSPIRFQLFRSNVPLAIRGSLCAWGSMIVSSSRLRITTSCLLTTCQARMLSGCGTIYA